MGWHYTDKEKPKDDVSVICCVSGKVRNIHYDNAIVMGSYFECEGWLYDGIKLEDADLITCHIWHDLPDLPKEYADE